jgi:hypothetical protein
LGKINVLGPKKVSNLSGDLQYAIIKQKLFEGLILKYLLNFFTDIITYSKYTHFKHIV